MGAPCLFERKCRFECRVLLTAVVLLATLFFGLRPKDFDFSNNIHWLPRASGLETGKYGIAYTAALKTVAGAEKGWLQGFTIEVAFKPLAGRSDGFGDLLVIYAGSDESQFVVGQWHSWLIAMNGADYVGSRKTRRIAVDAALNKSSVRFVTLSSGLYGAAIYLDGRPVQMKKAVRLALPFRDGARLILGNSADGTHPWRGEIYGLSIYGCRLSGETIAEHYRLWQKRQSFSFAIRATPLIAYFFDEASGDRVRDRSGAGRDLKIPPSMHILEKRVLRADWERFKSGAGLSDGFVNLLGFMPLGFVLAATFAAAGVVMKRWALPAAAAVCFIVSLVIEFAQAGIPSRSSDCLDLLLNTCGALLGAMLYGYLRKWPVPGVESMR